MFQIPLLLLSQPPKPRKDPAEEARLKAEEDERQHVAAEQRAKEEAEESERQRLHALFKEPIPRFVEQGQELRALLEETRRAVQAHVARTEKQDEWAHYTLCGPLPYPWDVKAVATYLSLWRDEAEQISAAGATPLSGDAVIARCMAAQQLRAHMQRALQDAPLLGRDASRLEALLGELGAVCDLYLDQFTLHVLQFADRYSSRPDDDVLLRLGDAGWTVCVWANVLRNPKTRDLAFVDPAYKPPQPDELDLTAEPPAPPPGFALAIPRSIAVASASLRLLWDPTRTVAAAAPVPALKDASEEFVYLDYVKAEEEAQAAAAAAAAAAATEAAATAAAAVAITVMDETGTGGAATKSAKSVPPSKPGTPASKSRPQSQRPPAKAPATPMTPAPAPAAPATTTTLAPPEPAAVPSSVETPPAPPTYLPVGPSIVLTLAEQPAAAHTIKKWTMRVLHQPNLMTLDYPIVDPRFASFDEPAPITVTLPISHVPAMAAAAFDGANLGWYDAKSCAWRPDGIDNIVIDEDKGIIQFDTVHVAPYSFVQPSTRFGTLHDWFLAPDATGTALTLHVADNVLVLHVDHSGCALTSAEPAIACVASLVNQRMPAAQLIQALTQAGLTIFGNHFTPPSTSAVKAADWERTLCHQLARAGACMATVRSSVFNAAAPDVCVLRVAAPGTPFDQPAMFRTLVSTVPHSYLARGCEGDASVTKDAVEGSEVHGTLLHALRAVFGASAPVPSPLVTNSLFTLLAAVRPLSYAHGRSAAAFAVQEQARLVEERTEAERLAEEARIAAEAEAARLAAAAAPPPAKSAPKKR